MSQQPPQLPAPHVTSWIQRHPLLLRFILVGVLTILLAIPLTLIRVTITERVSYAGVAESSIRETWGRDQTILGPVLHVPFSYSIPVKEWVGNADQRRLETRFQAMEDVLVILPERLAVQADLSPSERTRGLFRTWVYRGELQLQGSFSSDYQDSALPAGSVLHWDRSKLVLLARDLRGVDRPVALADGATFKASSVTVEGFQAMEATWAPGASRDFSVSMPIQGSGGFEVVPVGNETVVSVKSSWPDPHFYGLVLPSERSITPQGFNATWRFSEFTHGLPRTWRATAEEPILPIGRFQAKATGVRLDRAVSPQLMAERAIKYGFLFVVFVFGVLYGMDAVGPSRLRIAHYFWVGLAACLFFIVLLALAEIVAFGAAYLFATCVCVGMIVVFTRGLLGGLGRSIALGTSLGGIFGYLYVVLKMEDYALLAGAVALLAALGVAMKLTRRLVQ